MKEILTVRLLWGNLQNCDFVSFQCLGVYRSMRQAEMYMKYDIYMTLRVKKVSIIFKEAALSTNFL